jgi:hypothetical protein
VPDHCFDIWVRFAEGMSVKIPNTRGGLRGWWRTVSARGASIPTLTHTTVCEAVK